MGRAAAWLCLWTTIALAVNGSVHAQSQTASESSGEYAIKAAYLYNFGRYVEWPPQSFADSEAPFVIGLFGPDPFGSLLEQVAIQKRIDGRSIVVRRYASLADLTPCHIMFVASTASSQHKAALMERARRVPILLVGEESGFTEQGGMVNFVVVQDKVRFEINVGAALQAGLKISAKLLRLARIVAGG